MTINGLLRSGCPSDPKGPLNGQGAGGARAHDASGHGEVGFLFVVDGWRSPYDGVAIHLRQVHGLPSRSLGLCDVLDADARGGHGFDEEFVTI